VEVVDFIVRGHLGGYVRGGDPKTWNPLVWAALLQIFKPKTLIDVGCGEGHALAWFRSNGLDVLGLDGIPQPDRDILQHDFTEGPFIPVLPVDLIWCCEFVEHVEDQYKENFLKTFDASRVIAMTHALPGQPGHHHVNCREAQYWIDLLTSRGFIYQLALTTQLRGLEPDTWFGQQGLVFTR
jgi:cyclopropane fatty-acyl-phospholipid synthase-like methyltransferase